MQCADVTSFPLESQVLCETLPENQYCFGVFITVALSSLFLRIDRTLYPVELRQFVEAYEAVSTSGNKSKGEGLDAQLEEVNKASKCWENGVMNAREWLTIFRNHDQLTKASFKSFWLCYLSLHFLMSNLNM